MRNYFQSRLFCQYFVAFCINATLNYSKNVNKIKQKKKELCKKQYNMEKKSYWVCFLFA